MAQPTLEGLTLNAGSGGSDLACDTVSSKLWQAILVGYSTGDGAANVVMADTGLPVVAQSGATWAVTQSGTWNIGTVTAVTGITNALPAGDNNIGNVDVATMPSNTTANGTITAAAQTVTCTPAAGSGTTGLQVMGTWVGQLEFEGTIDGTNYASVEASNGTSTVNATTGNDIFILPAAGYLTLRVRASSWTSGTATITFNASIGASASVPTGSLPSGDNNIGNVDIASSVALDVSAATVQVQSNSANIATESTLSTLSAKIAACNTNAVIISSGAVGVTGNVTAAQSTHDNFNCNANAQQGNVDVATGNALYVQPGTGAVFQVQSNSANLATQATLAAVQTAVEIIDDWDDGSDHCEVVGAAAEDAAVSGAPVLTAGRYDSTERATETGDATTLATSAQGWMMVGNQSGYLFDGATRCQIKRTSGLAATGTTAMVAAVAGKKFRILALALFATSATVTNVYVATTTDTDVLGNSGNPIPLATDADGDNIAGFSLPYNQGGWTETSTANEALNLVLSAAQDVIYALTYLEVD
jgi:hypothetical protein